MKEITIKLQKGESTIFVALAAADARGVKTEDPNAVAGYIVAKGGSFGYQTFTAEEKDLARLQFYARIGQLVADGYLTV